MKTFQMHTKSQNGRYILGTLPNMPVHVAIVPRRFSIEQEE